MEPLWLGEKMTIMMVQMWRLVEGKVVEKRSVADEIEVYKKAGLIKYTEQGKKADRSISLFQ